MNEYVNTLFDMLSPKTMATIFLDVGDKNEPTGSFRRSVRAKVEMTMRGRGDDQYAQFMSIVGGALFDTLSSDNAVPTSLSAVPNVGALRDELAGVIELALDAGAWDYGSEEKLAWVDRLEELSGARWESDEDEFSDLADALLAEEQAADHGWELDDSYIHLR